MLETLPLLYAALAGGAVVAIGGYVYTKAKNGMRPQKLRFAISLLKSLQEQPDTTDAAKLAAQKALEATLTAQAQAEAAKLV